jgi:phosphatidylglycerol:prolipoprotein diacylglycerol transferase
MVALGFLAGLWTASRRALLDGVSGETISDLGPWLIVGAIVGARILYVLSYWREQFAGQPFYEIFMIQHGGLVFYGGFIGSSSAYLIYCWLKKLSIWQGADILAPSVSLGHALGRIGCLFNGCCYGSACSLPWGISYPAGNVAQAPTTPVHPTQIYEAVLNFGLYAGLAWLFRRKKFDGQIFALYMIGYAVIRSTVELFRGDYPAYQYVGGWFTPAHWVSVPVLLAGIILFFVLPRKRAHQPKAS